MSAAMILSFRGDHIRAGENGWTQAAVDHLMDMQAKWREVMFTHMYRDVVDEDFLASYDLLVDHMTQDWKRNRAGAV